MFDFDPAANTPLMDPSKNPEAIESIGALLGGGGEQAPPQ